MHVGMTWSPKTYTAVGRTKNELVHGRSRLVMFGSTTIYHLFDSDVMSDVRWLQPYSSEISLVIIVGISIDCTYYSGLLLDGT